MNELKDQFMLCGRKKYVILKKINKIRKYPIMHKNKQ